MEQNLKVILENFQLQLKGLEILIQYSIMRQESAQVKSSLILAALNTNGETIIKSKKSRNHSELLFKHLKLPIKVLKKKNYDLIKIKGKKKYQH